jgi:hypothetical protein
MGYGLLRIRCNKCVLMRLFSPRLLNCQPEYWTGYRIKHRDSPFTSGSLALDYEPESGIARAVVPVSTVRALLALITLLPLGLVHSD